MVIDQLRREFTVRKGYWFAPKLFGYGATPVTWQGWAVTLGFAAMVIALAALIRDPAAGVAVATALTVPFLVLVHAKTDGGWHWRWGVTKRG